jgi:hypothetical protein
LITGTRSRAIQGVDHAQRVAARARTAPQIRSEESACRTRDEAGCHLRAMSLRYRAPVAAVAIHADARQRRTAGIHAAIDQADAKRRRRARHGCRSGGCTCSGQVEMMEFDRRIGHRIAQCAQPACGRAITRVAQLRDRRRDVVGFVADDREACCVRACKAIRIGVEREILAAAHRIARRRDIDASTFPTTQRVDASCIVVQGAERRVGGIPRAAHGVFDRRAGQRRRRQRGQRHLCHGRRHGQQARQNRVETGRPARHDGLLGDDGTHASIGPDDAR